MVNDAGQYTTIERNGTYSVVKADDGAEDYDWEQIEPNTVDNDEELREALEGTDVDDQKGDRQLHLNPKTWGGMESGAIKYDSTQTEPWFDTIPEIYKPVAQKWLRQQGVLKITPLQQRQKYTYSTVSYIAKKQEEPKTQIFPISDVSVVPHQITFDFYDTTEGRVGVSNAVEKHMTVECDVYLTDLIAQYWIFGGDNQYNLGLSTMPEIKRKWWEAVENNTYLNFEGDLENTSEFAEFRSTFLQQHSGWVCRFTSHTFGVFQGVITDVSYSISSGESFAKWHLKFEEAIFIDGAYQETGKKAESTTTGDTENSGDAGSAEDAPSSE